MPEHYTHEEHIQLHRDIVALEAELIEERRVFAKAPTHYTSLAIQITLQKIGTKREKLRSYMKALQGGKTDAPITLRPGD